MISENEYILSFYEPLSVFGEKENVELVKNTATGKLYVKKTLSVYDRSVFEFIYRNRPQNVPKIVEILEDGDELIVIEEYFSGRSVRELMNERGPLSAEETLQIVDSVAQTLMPFHAADPPIVHRDIKPENLLISSDGVVKLVDFNAAKYITPEKPRDTELFGTAGYAAPEQYGFASSLPATDIYALGVLITELSTGAEDPERVPYPLRDIAKRCMRLDPADRYENAAALHEALTGLPDLKPSHKPAAVPAGFRSWLPPGFRTHTWWKIIIAVVGYALIFVLTVAGASLQTTVGGHLVEYAMMLVPALGAIFIDFNYRGVWEALPLLKSSSRPLRILGLILYPVIITLCTWIILIAISIMFNITINPGT